jgi:hypothetical protein
MFDVALQVGKPYSIGCYLGLHLGSNCIIRSVCMRILGAWRGDAFGDVPVQVTRKGLEARQSRKLMQLGESVIEFPKTLRFWDLKMRCNDGLGRSGERLWQRINWRCTRSSLSSHGPQPTARHGSQAGALDESCTS